MIIRTDDPVVVGETGHATIWDGALQKHPEVPYLVLAEVTRSDWEAYWKEQTSSELFSERMRTANQWPESAVRYYKISID